MPHIEIHSNSRLRTDGKPLPNWQGQCTPMFSIIISIYDINMAHMVGRMISPDAMNEQSIIIILHTVRVVRVMERERLMGWDGMG